MKIHEWEVWHTYSTYLTNPPVDLDGAAHALIESRLAPLVLRRDGETYWREKDTCATGETLFDLTPDTTQVAISLQKTNPKDLGPVDFAGEAWLWGAQFRFCELRVFGDRPFPPDYLRAFLGEFQLKSADANYSGLAYPVLKLYGGGELLLEWRVIGPSEPVELAKFIDRGVNLYRVPFDEVKVPPGLSSWSVDAYWRRVRRWPIHWRAVIAWLQKGHDKAVEEQTSVVESGDFRFAYAPLSRDEGHRDTLASLSQTIFATVAHVLTKPSKGWRFVLRGDASRHDVGEYWVGRPHIHLTRFDGQAPRSTETLQRCKPAFGQIIMRGTVDEQEIASDVVPADARRFEDYNALVAHHLTLWAWSLRGLEQQKPWADPNRGHLVYEHQAIAEMLDFGHITHRSMLERAASHSSIDSVLRDRLAASKLKLELSQSSPASEIRELLECTWDEMGVPGLQRLIDETLETRASQASLREARRSNLVGRRLTVLFGLIAVPPLADLVLRPLWDLLGWWAPAGVEGKSLFLMFVAVLIVAFVLWMSARASDDSKH